MSPSRGGYRYYHPRSEDCRLVVTQVSNWSAWWLVGDVCGMVYQGKQEASNRCLAGVGGVGDFFGLLGVAKKGEEKVVGPGKKKKMMLGCA